TGRPPFQADNLVATLEMVRTQEPAPVRGINPACPRDLETICLKCLEKDAGRRYNSAQALAEDLGRFLNNEPIRARPVSTWERVWRTVQRRKREVAWASCAALALAILAGLIVHQSYVRARERRQTRDDYLEAV